MTCSLYFHYLNKTTRVSGSGDLNNTDLLNNWEKDAENIEERRQNSSFYFGTVIVRIDINGIKLINVYDTNQKNTSTTTSDQIGNLDSIHCANIYWQQDCEICMKKIKIIPLQFTTCYAFCIGTSILFTPPAASHLLTALEDMSRNFLSVLKVATEKKDAKAVVIPAQNTITKLMHVVNKFVSAARMSRDEGFSMSKLYTIYSCSESNSIADKIDKIDDIATEWFKKLSNTKKRGGAETSYVLELFPLNFNTTTGEYKCNLVWILIKVEGVSLFTQRTQNSSSFFQNKTQLRNIFNKLVLSLPTTYNYNNKNDTILVDGDTISLKNQLGPRGPSSSTHVLARGSFGTVFKIGDKQKYVYKLLTHTNKNNIGPVFNEVFFMSIIEKERDAMSQGVNNIMRFYGCFLKGDQFGMLLEDGGKNLLMCRETTPTTPSTPWIRSIPYSNITLIDLMDHMRSSSLQEQEIELYKYCFYIDKENKDRIPDRSVSELKTLLTQESHTLLNDILDGLQFLHAKNIIHMDLKLENILVDSNNKCRICDFGETSWHNASYNGYTPYSAHPLQIKHLKYGKASFAFDIWAVGVIYFLLQNPSFTIPGPLSRSTTPSEEFHNGQSVSEQTIQNDLCVHIPHAIQYNLIVGKGQRWETEVVFDYT
jgi:hypothetical protein